MDIQLDLTYPMATVLDVKVGLNSCRSVSGSRRVREDSQIPRLA
jgi:hypothetical protein